MRSTTVFTFSCIGELFEKKYERQRGIRLLGIALELTESELEELLEKASYSLPKNQVFDLIIRFCFKEKIYDLNQINEFLFDHKCKTLSE